MSARVEMGDGGGSGGGKDGGEDGRTLALFRTAAADDLRLLASLHDRERGAHGCVRGRVEQMLSALTRGACRSPVAA